MKKGVSLIVLIITVIAMVILAGVIILTISSTNTIGRANESKFKQNVSNYQDELNSYISEKTLEKPEYNPENLNLYGTDVKRAIPSMSDEDTQIFSVVAGKLTVNEDTDDDYKTWAEQVGVKVSEKFPETSGTPSTSAPVTSAPVTSAPAMSATLVGGAIDGVSLADIRASISADTNPGYTVSGGVRISTGSRVAQQYYGNKVSYSANGIDDWQIFYIDSSNIYLIATEYIPYNKLPGYDSVADNGNMTKKANKEYNAFFNSTSSMREDISATNKMVTRGYMPITDMNVFGLNTTTESNGKYIVKSGVTLNNDFKSALYLLDEAEWSGFVNTSKKGEVAYGGPAVRMMVTSTNEYFGTSVTTLAETQAGYKYSGYTMGGTGYYYYLPVTTDSVYIKRTTTNADAYFLAGPSAGNIYFLVTANHGGDMYYDGYNATYSSNNVGFRVLVSLSSDATLTWNSTTNKYDIS